VARKLTDTVKLQVRLSERLRRRLEQAAKHHDWSMNTEIVNRLDSSLQQEDQKEMIRTAVQEGLMRAQEADSKLRIEQPPGLSAEKEEKLK
jgi:hypothetical protein